MLARHLGLLKDQVQLSGELRIKWQE
jgi:hypothetical protein